MIRYNIYKEQEKDYKILKVKEYFTIAKVKITKFLKKEKLDYIKEITFNEWSGRREKISEFSTKEEAIEFLHFHVKQTEDKLIGHFCASEDGKSRSYVEL